MSSEEDDIVGHITMGDGSRVPLTRAEGDAIMKQVEANEARKSEQMPTSKEAVATMYDAYDRLRQLGWNPGSYCPKDGTRFAIIEHGSTGVFTGSYFGEWPSGYVIAEDCVLRPGGLLWKPIEKLTEWEENARQQAAEDTRQYIKRYGKQCQSRQNFKQNSKLKCSS